MIRWCCLDCPTEFEFRDELVAHVRATGHEPYDLPVNIKEN